MSEGKTTSAAEKRTAGTVCRTARYVSAHHDAYTPHRHTRDLFLIKHRYVLVLDHVTSQDTDWIHTYRRLLHFDFGVEVAVQGQRLEAHCDGTALTCIATADGGESIKIWRE